MCAEEAADTSSLSTEMWWSGVWVILFIESKLLSNEYAKYATWIIKTEKFGSGHEAPRGKERRRENSFQNEAENTNNSSSSNSNHIFY
jgi:hypothetical protein